MFIKNPEIILKEKKYYCKSKNLKRFLTEVKKIPYISKEYKEETKKCIWIYIKTQQLKDALNEWSYNKNNGIRAIE
jgi:hypothetical protein